MPIKSYRSAIQVAGFSLIELVVFLTVISIGLVVLLKQFNQSVVNSTDPVIQLRALECAQAKLDEISARKFDENSPVGGIPACGSAETGAVACAGIASDSGFDDVGDYNGTVDTAKTGCSIAVSVVAAGDELGLTMGWARRVTVTATSQGGGQVTLSTYRTNF